MKIKRFGISFKLTEEELYEAYLEQQHLFDMANVENEIITSVPDGDVCWDEVIQEMLNNEQMISDIADVARSDHENNYRSYGAAIEEAVLDAINQMEEKRNQAVQIYV